MSTLGCLVRRCCVAVVAAITVFALPVQLAGCDCTDADCGDSLSIHGAIGIPASDPARLRITVCRNGTCGQDTLSREPVPEETTYAKLQLSGTVDAQGSLRSDPGDEYWHLSVSFGACGPEGDFEDGDVVLLEVTDLATSVLLVDINEAVVFETGAPNGEWCGPICLEAEIPIPAP